MIKHPDERIQEACWRKYGVFKHPVLSITPHWLVEVLTASEEDKIAPFKVGNLPVWSEEQINCILEGSVDTKIEELNLSVDFIKRFRMFLNSDNKREEFRLTDLIEEHRFYPISYEFVKENDELIMYINVFKAIEEDKGIVKVLVNVKCDCLKLNLGKIEAVKKDKEGVMRLAFVLTRYLMEVIGMEISRRRGANIGYGDFWHALKLSEKLEKFHGLKGLKNIIRAFKEELEVVNN